MTRLFIGNIKGPAGGVGKDGKSAYETAKEAGYTGTEEELAQALNNIPGHITNKSNPHGVTLAQTGGSNPNLLDNWYFADLINQRGKTEYTEAGYTIDRWVFIHPNTFNVDTGTFYFNVGKSYQQMSQKVENWEWLVGKTVTLSALVETDIEFRIRIVYGESASNELIQLVPAGTKGVVSVTGIIPQGATQLWAQPVTSRNNAPTSGSVTLIAAKLELGSEQTLAHQDENGNWVLNDPPPNKQQELAKCQRYAIEVLNRQETGQNYIAPLIATNTARAYGLLPLPETMRDTPSALYSCSAEAPYWLVGIAADGKYINVIPVVAVTVYRKMEHGVVIYADINAEQYSLAPGNWYQLYVRETNKHSLLLTADL